MYHAKKNFFPLLHIIDSGLFLSGYSEIKQRKFFFFPEPQTVDMGEIHKSTPFISCILALREASWDLLEDSLTHKTLKDKHSNHHK